MNPYNYDPAAANALSFPFAYLLDFFHAVGGAAPSHFYRVLDYVEVRSPFVGAETWLSPTQFGATGPQLFRAPFNYVSNYRDPGKVNINTITSQAVWDAVVNCQRRRLLSRNWLTADEATPRQTGGTQTPLIPPSSPIPSDPSAAMT